VENADTERLTEWINPNPHAFVRVSFQPNTIYCGDCKDVLRHFPEKSVDLIYADPPFFSNRRYEVIWGDGYELRAFEDRWKGGISNYVAWMMERVRECHRVMKDTGSLYLHLDHHASHYMKVEMDKLFGETNFINEIVWKRTIGGHSDTKQGAKHYGRSHDVILFYTKGDGYTWHQQFEPYSEEYKESFYKNVEPETGRRYALSAIDGPGGASKGNPHYEFLGVTRYWRYSKEHMEQLFKEGRIIQTKPGNVPRYKRYLDEMKGVPLSDVWENVKPIAQAKESLGYPTQKPEELLDRMILTSSNPADIILDPFCGCGTAIAVAHKLGRRWVGVDVSPTACKLMAKRMRSLRAKVNEIGLPKTVSDLKKVEPFEFQNWVVEKLYARISPRKTGDMGIDGYYLDGTPIQVKQSEDVGRNPVDNFETAIERAGRTKGVIVAFSFGKGAHEEVARAKLEKNLEIILKTVEEILKET
jgi:DNA modification methylase